MRDFLENTLERIIFASRWLLAPIYVVLCLSLLFITIKVIQETIHYLPLMLVQDVKGIMLFVLHIVDLVLVGNLVLMIISTKWLKSPSSWEAKKIIKMNVTMNLDAN